MNEDKNTTEYLDSIKGLKLSESSRARIEGELMEYAKFHPVRVVEVNRSSSVPFGTALFSKYITMPIATLIAVFVAAGTSFAANGAVPGDLLYPVKTNINEPVGSALAIGVDAQARFEAKVLEERVEEANELKAEGELSGQLATEVSDEVALQAASTLEASANSETSVKQDVESRARLALQKFVTLVGSDSELAAKATVQLNAISLATGEMDIDLLEADITTRIDVLQNVVNEAAANLETDVRTRFNTKLNSALSLTAEVANKTEAEVRESLNDAAVLIGEVEAELSTLGQVEVNDNGMITDIDFSIDPMNDEATSSADSDTTTSSSVDVEADATLDTDMIDVDLDSDTSAAASSGLVF